MAEESEHYVIKRSAQRDDIENGASDEIYVRAPNKDEALDLFDHANSSYNVGDSEE